MKFYIFLIYFWCVSPCVLYAGIDHLLPAPQQVIANGQRYKVASAETHPLIIVERVADLPEIPINKEEGYLLEVTKIISSLGRSVGEACFGQNKP